MYDFSTRLRRILAAVSVFTLLAASVGAEDLDYDWPVTGIVDGDELTVDASADLPPELSSLKVRVRGVETPTPEGLGENCDKRREIARAATEFTAQVIGDADKIVVRNPQWWGFARGVKADVWIDGQSLAILLIRAGLGRGSDDDDNWC